ncbi:MAG: YfhO family protein [Clostridium butyricum]|nr:YfhO family protein [Clostridium butyricum]
MVYYGFWKANKTFIWNIDGFKQHFPAMYEFRENIRTALGSGLKDIPFWNWDLGLGFNLSFIYTYDMFYWLTIFLPIEWLVNAYSILIILKLYLSGLFLILYLFEINIIGYSSIIGGLVYSFCGYALFAGIRHPFFISPMVIFPLVILGIEKYFIKNKSGLLVISVFIATVSHYYFLYMIGIGSAIYMLWSSVFVTL